MQAQPDVHSCFVHPFGTLHVGDRNIRSFAREHDCCALCGKQVAQLEGDEQVDLVLRNACFYANAARALPLLGAFNAWGDPFQTGIRRFLLAGVNADHAAGKPPRGFRLLGFL